MTLTIQAAAMLAAAYDAHRPTLWTAYKARRDATTTHGRMTPAAALAAARDALDDCRERAFAYESAAARRDAAKADHEAQPGDATVKALAYAAGRMLYARSRLERARGNAMPMPRRAPAPLGHGDVIRARDSKGRRRTFVVAIMPDYDTGKPWEEHDGHGPVRRGRPDQKRAGEIAFPDGWLYDFAGACRKARTEGWGYLPGPLEIATDDAGKRPYARRGGWAVCRAARLAAYDADDVNKAIRVVYDRHRATMSARQYAADAARADFDRLAGWARDSWSWVGVGVVELPHDGRTYDAQRVADHLAYGGGRGLGLSLAASLWGIESDSPDYHAGVARELVAELLAAHE